MPNVFSQVAMRLTGEDLIKMANDKDTLEFAHQLVMTGIWIELRDFIDHIYGENCFYYAWEFNLTEGVVEIKDMIPFDKDKNIIAATVEQKDEAILFFEDDSSLAYLMCAYNLKAWDRHAIDVGTERIEV